MILTARGKFSVDKCCTSRMNPVNEFGKLGMRAAFNLPSKWMLEVELMIVASFFVTASLSVDQQAGKPARRQMPISYRPMIRAEHRRQTTGEMPTSGISTELCERIESKRTQQIHHFLTHCLAHHANMAGTTMQHKRI